MGGGGGGGVVGGLARLECLRAERERERKREKGRTRDICVDGTARCVC